MIGRKLVKSLIIFFGLGIGWATTLAQPTLSVSPGIIPQPVSYQTTRGAFALSSRTVIQSTNGVAPTTALFAQQAIVGLTGYRLPLNKKGGSGRIRLAIDSLQIRQPEGYRLVISDQQITITGHDDAGVFYGLQSLLQLVQQSATATYRIGACVIEDHPRFAYRGMHLDVSRHQFPVQFIKKYIDLLALYKFNTFHWHLTDDQGWRIEIKQYPALQQKAAYRSETLIGHKKELPRRFDGQRYGGYYTQAEVREIVQYAMRQHITVIPEIEMPGHAMAALSAYPQLGCPDEQGGVRTYHAATFWGIFDEVFCAGNDSTFVFLQNVLDEVVQLFPSRYIHIGGDECPKTRWKACPRCQARIRTEHLKDEHELQSYFIRRIERHLNSRGRQIIGWDEILEGGLSPGATVMSWQGITGGIEAMRQKHDAIMTPEPYVYFDYYQSLYPEEPLAAAGYTPLSKVYSYEPVPAELTAEEAKYLKGVQGTAWSEYFTSPEQAEYMIFPRAIAVAEIAWTSRENRSYPDFLRRLRQHDGLLKSRQVHYANRFDEITDSVTVETNGSVRLKLTTTLPGAVIHYTVDGTTPTAQSPVYSPLLTLEKSATVQAAVFEKGQQTGRVFRKAFDLNKATGKWVTFVNAPKGGYRPASLRVAVNGVVGTSRYNTGEWIGFQGDDVDGTIDLGTIQSISTIRTHVLNYHWQRMWAPTVLRFLISEDGKTFREVYRGDQFPINGINPVEARFTPVAARYVRVVATGQGTIPAGEYGAGGKAWLLLDEFGVD